MERQGLGDEIKHKSGPVYWRSQKLYLDQDSKVYTVSIGPIEGNKVSGSCETILLVYPHRLTQGDVDPKVNRILFFETRVLGKQIRHHDGLLIRLG